MFEIETFDSEGEFGYKQITTFYQDFSIAEKISGGKGVIDTYCRAFQEWKENYKYLTELVMVLNWKCWRWYEHNETLCRLYEDLFYKAKNYAYENLKGEELSYFINTTD